jgi:HD superfamily phosphohydrolase YqeK
MCPPSGSARNNSNESQRTGTGAQFVPSSNVCEAAYAFASSNLHPAILNHSVRVWLYAKTLAERSDSAYTTDAAKRDLLFAACILHDIGTVENFDGSLRFEVEGADAAADFLRGHGISEDDAHQVWMAIALHTSPHIAERINELCRLVRVAVLLDFGKAQDQLEGVGDLKRTFENSCGRFGVEKVLGDLVAEQAVKKPEKAPAASWPNNLYKAHLAEPDWDGVNKGF